MKLLDGRELADFIKARQAKQVRMIRQSLKTVPKLAIIQTVDSPVIDAYVRLKKRYGADILVDVDAHSVTVDQVVSLLDTLNADPNTHGIIIQLPVSDPAETDRLVNYVAPQKDVDGLGDRASFLPATPTAILWLLAGYGIEPKGKQVLVIGQGRLVGAPLAKVFRDSGVSVLTADEATSSVELLGLARRADILVSAAGVPGLVTPEMVRNGMVLIDAGVATEAGKLVGDIDEAVRENESVIITPKKGGVGPLTVCALFDNVIQAAMIAAEKSAA